MHLGAAIRPACPVGRVEQLAVGGDRLDAGKRVGGAHQADQLAPPLALAQQPGKLLVIARRGAADARQHVHRIAQLLQNRVVRDRADLPQAHLAFRGNVGLAARDAAAGGIEQAQPECGDRAGVCAAVEMRPLVLLDRAIEIEAEVGPAIERIGRGFGIGFGRAELGKAGEGGESQLGRREEQIAVTALEADFGLERDPGAHEAPLGPRGQRP